MTRCSSTTYTIVRRMTSITSCLRIIPVIWKQWRKDRSKTSLHNDSTIIIQLSPVAVHTLKLDQHVIEPTCSNTFRSGERRFEASDLITWCSTISALCWTRSSLSRTACNRVGTRTSHSLGQSNRAILDINTANCVET